MTATYSQDIDRTRSAEIGASGITDQTIDAAVVTVENALKRLREEAKSGAVGILKMPGETGDVAEIERTAKRIAAGATDLVFLGTGGSSLGAQALAQLKDWGIPGLGLFRGEPRVHFLDNLDPVTFQALLGKLPLATTSFVAVSKSGGTGETLLQSMAVIAALEAKGLKAGERITGLSEPQKPGAKANALRALLEPLGVPFLEHRTDVGGRYSVLTNVGLLPAAAMGLDVKTIRRGAAQVLDDVLAGKSVKDTPAALGAAINVAAAHADKGIAITMAYSDRFEKLMKWWQQLWAESLGKDGKGTQPVAALGPVDQHSQVQLYLGGPRDKLFTIMTTGIAGKGPKIEDKLAKAGHEPDFSGRTIGDFVAAQGRATADTLAKNGCATRAIHIETLDEVSFGAILMHFMVETILTGYAMGVDPYDQPAVEEGKILAKQYLAQSKG